jgi:hypothetical protein
MLLLVCCLPCSVLRAEHFLCLAQNIGLHHYCPLVSICFLFALFTILTAFSGMMNGDFEIFGRKQLWPNTRTIPITGHWGKPRKHIRIAGVPTGIRKKRPKNSSEAILSSVSACKFYFNTLITDIVYRCYQHTYLRIYIYICTDYKSVNFFCATISKMRIKYPRYYCIVFMYCLLLFCTPVHSDMFISYLFYVLG